MLSADRKKLTVHHKITSPRLAPGQALQYDHVEAGFNEFRRWKKLVERVRATADGDDADKHLTARKKLFDWEVKLGIISWQEASKLFDEFGFDREKDAEFYQLLINIRFLEHLREVEDTVESRDRVGKIFFGMFEAGEIPYIQNRNEFWRWIFYTLVINKDTAGYEKVLEHIRQSDDEMMKRGLGLLEQQLEGIKSGG